MLPLKIGALCLLAIVSRSGCRKDTPPVFSVICLGDGFGGADCSVADGSRKYLKPSELKNFWMTTNADMQNYTSWCYQASPAAVRQVLEDKGSEIKSYPVEVVNP